MALTDPPIPLPLRDLIPARELFWRDSRTHGHVHVARVMVHAFRLIAAVGPEDLAPALWAAVYLHDIARQHDGHCTRHGADAWARLADLPDVRKLFAAGGVREFDYPAIKEAVTRHCCGEVAPDHAHRRLAALLKDADGLDRVRIWDLDPRYLRHPEAVLMVGYANALLGESLKLPSGPDYFERLWPAAMRLENQ